MTFSSLVTDARVALYWNAAAIAAPNIDDEASGAFDVTAGAVSLRAMSVGGGGNLIVTRLCSGISARLAGENERRGVTCPPTAPQLSRP